MRETVNEALLGSFDLEAEIGRFPPGVGAAGRRAETLVKTDRLRVVLITMRGGALLAEHTAPGPITVQALRGRFVVDVAGEERALGTGSLIAIEAGVRHAVHAGEDGVFLLTIAWPAGAGDGHPAAMPDRTR